MVDYAELISQVLNIILPAAATLLAAWFAVLGNKMKIAYEEKANTEIKQNVVKATVAWVQQLYAALEGPEKLEKAVDRASALLTEKGIAISDLELEMLIESAVYGLKQGLTTEVLDTTVIEELTQEAQEEKAK